MTATSAQSLFSACLIWQGVSFQPVPLYSHAGTVMMEDFLRFTQKGVRPAILQKYGNISVFQDLCSCKTHDPKTLDALELAYIPGDNVRKQMQLGHTPEGSVSGTSLWSDHICQQKPIYAAYDGKVAERAGAKFRASIHQWLNMNEPLIKTRSMIQDHNFSVGWYNDVYMGYAKEDYQDPRVIGSLPHQADDQHYYLQVCGTKRWIFTDALFRFEDDTDLASDGQVLKGKRSDTWFKHSQKMFLGHSRPGDLVLVPVWLWHMEQVGKGSNFGVSWKMPGNFIRQLLQTKPALCPRKPGEKPQRQLEYKEIVKLLISISTFLLA